MELVILEEIDHEADNMDNSDTSRFLYLIETPVEEGKYPANLLCYFVIGKK